MKWLISLFCAASCFAQVGLRSPAFVANLHPAASVSSGCDSVNDSSLKAYYKLGEATGADRADSKGANTLTDAGPDDVIQNTGIIGNGAQFLGSTGTKHYLTIADNANLSASGSYSIACWIQFGDANNNRRAVCGKLSSDGITFEYGLEFHNSDSRLRFDHDGASVSATTFGAVPRDTWMFVVCIYDDVNHVMRIRVNDSAEDSTSHTGYLDSTSNFSIGRLGDFDGFYWDGLVDEFLFTKRVLTSTEITALYNSGAGCLPSGL